MERASSATASRAHRGRSWGVLQLLDPAQQIVVPGLEGIDLKNVGFNEISVLRTVEAPVGLLDQARVWAREVRSSCRSTLSARSRRRRENMRAASAMRLSSFRPRHTGARLVLSLVNERYDIVWSNIPLIKHT